MNLSRTNKNITLAISLLLLTSFTGCKTKQVQVVEEVKSVKVVQSTRGTLELKTEYSSKLKPIEEVSVTSKVGGKVDNINAVVGQQVNKGDVLFTIDKKEAEAQYSQTQASLESANANLTRTKDSSLAQQILQAEITLKQAQVQYDDAKSNYDKNKTLYDQGVITKQDFDNADVKLKNTSIQLDSSKDALSLLKDKIGPQSIDVASSQLAQSQTAVDLARIQLDNYTITSPISGTISVKNVNVGELVSSAVNAYTIINTQTLVAEVSVSDKMMSKLKNGDKIQFKVNAVGDKIFEGIISSISPNLDSKTQFYTVKINFDNSEGLLKSGMFSKIYFSSEKKDNVILINNEAIVVESGVPFVYTVNNGIIKKKNITTGLANEKVTEVTSNLNEGEEIIAEGQTFLSDGQKVNVVK